MAPLIERMFRYTWFLATERRDAMLREGRQKELDALVAEARAFPGIAARGRSGLSRPGRPDGRIAAVQTEIPRIAHVFR